MSAAYKPKYRLSHGYRVVLEIDPDILQALGRVAAQWGHLEHSMAWEIKMLCKRANIPIPKQAASLSFDKRLRGWRALVNELVTDPDEKANWLEIITDIKLMEDERHRLGLIDIQDSQRR